MALTLKKLDKFKNQATTLESFPGRAIHLSNFEAVWTDKWRKIEGKKQQVAISSSFIFNFGKCYSILKTVDLFERQLNTL